jgi:hypothetical protein
MNAIWNPTLVEKYAAEKEDPIAHILAPKFAIEESVSLVISKGQRRPANVGNHSEL